MCRGKHFAMAAAAIAAVMLAAPASAAVIIQESFTGDELPAGFSLASDSSDRAPDYTGDGIVFAGDGDDARNYVRTDGTEYHQMYLEVYLTVETQLGTSWGDDSQLFLGLGSGEIGEYGVPDRGEAHGVYLVLNQEPSGLEVIQPYPEGREELEEWSYIGDADQTQVTVTAVRMLYDPVDRTVQYGVDFNYAGDGTYAAFTADQTTDPVTIPTETMAAWDNGWPSSIVFGGDSDSNSDLIVRDMLVIPEPATMGLLGIGGLALMLRRKRS